MTSVAVWDSHVDMATDDEIDLSTKNGRLKWARINANFRSARSAGVAMGLKPSTYPAHENGQNQFEEDAAKLYGKTFGVSWVWLLLGTGSPGPSQDDLALYATMDAGKPAPKRPARQTERSLPKDP